MKNKMFEHKQTGLVYPATLNDEIKIFGYDFTHNEDFVHITDPRNESLSHFMHAVNEVEFLPKFITLLEGQQLRCPFTDTLAEVISMAETSTFVDICGNHKETRSMPRLHVRFTRPDGSSFAVKHDSAWALWNMRLPSGETPLEVMEDMSEFFGSHTRCNIKFDPAAILKEIKFFKAREEKPSIEELVDIRERFRGLGVVEGLTFILPKSLRLSKTVYDSVTRLYEVKMSKTGTNVIELPITIEASYAPIWGLQKNVSIKWADGVIEQMSWSSNPALKVTDYDFLKAVTSSIDDTYGHIVSFEIIDED
ncbi:hypothetical protein CZP2022_56 [Vibrio phage C-ZP2022]|nr:hypothetical protein CZP2022_56 [Vibrio phage C-ZP2022]